MADSFSSNLGNYDPDGQYPSAASPLDIDELLKARPVNGPAPASWAAWPGQQGTGNREQGSGTDTRNLKPVTSPSATARAGTDYSGLAMGQLQQGESDLTAAEQAAASPEPTNPDLDALNTKIAGESVPTQLRANRAPGEAGPGMGEMLAQYKPSGWDRFGRGVRGAAIGLLTGGIPGAALGAIEPQDVKGGTAYGAPNKAYQQAETERTATLANDEAQLPGMSEKLKQTIEARRQRIADNEKLGADRGTMGRDVTAVGTAANETPEAKAKAEDLKNATDFADRQQRWKTVGNLVPPSQRDAQQAHYLLTGQLPEPQQPRQASPEEVLVGQGISKFRQQYHREPNVTEWAGIVQAAKGTGGGAGGGEKNLWSVPQPDGSKKVVSIQAGDTIPAGAVSLSGQSSENLKSGGADAPTIDALRYANDYLQSGAFTGTSDEALQDQFFQMAKPSTGFRMNQAQIDQLHKMSSWMNSLEGWAYHKAKGTWFAPEQRQQIVQTMNDLAKSKGIDPTKLPPAGGGAAQAPAAANTGGAGPGQGAGFDWGKEALPVGGPK